MKLVVKVGTGVLTKSVDGSLDKSSMVRLVTALSELMHGGHQVTLVSSGAVGAGVRYMGLENYPTDVATKQACAALGQSRLMHAYSALFQHFDLNVAQLLLTADDFKYRSQYIVATLEKLIQHGSVVPVINENDTVSIEELRFGDNDALSVLVAKMIQADALFLLSTVDGLHSPENMNGPIIQQVTDIHRVMSYAVEDKGKFSMGGMATKLLAIQSAVESGIPTYLLHGHHPDRIQKLIEGEGVGTFFVPSVK